MRQESFSQNQLSDLEKSVVDDISIEVPWALLETFADLHRVSGSEDELQAAEYLTDRLDAFGVTHNRYDPELYISQPHDASLSVVDKPLETGPVKTVSFSASTRVKAEMTYVGEASVSDVGKSADTNTQYHATVGQHPYEDVEPAEVEGKIALTAAGSLSIRASRILEQKGAVGVVAIHQHDREPHSGIATPIWGGAPRYDERDRLPEIPIVNVTKPTGEHLKQWCADGSPTVELETDLTTDWFECPVVEARIQGGADPDDEDFVLLHGHYDSWYVGITDNATGDAGMLELARVLENHSDELNRNLRIAWWPAHSTGRYAGSTWYADKFGHELVDDCVAHFNMDSPGAKGSAEYVDMACWVPALHDLVGGAIEDVTGLRYEENRPRRAGDYSFNNIGLGGAFTLSSNIPTDGRDEQGWHPVGGCGGNADAWHLSTDTLDTAGKQELVRDIRMYAVCILRTLTANVLPLNHRRSIKRHRDVVENYDDLVGNAFDFSPTLEALETLGEELTGLYDSAGSTVQPAAANECLKHVGRILTRLNFTQNGPFEQDPAVRQPSYPRYAGATYFRKYEPDDDEYRFLQLQLKREQNHVVQRLRDARRTVADVTN